MEQQQRGRIGRRLSAIVAADVAGYSRLMGLDEVGTARTLREHRAVIDALVAKHGGRLVKSTGDGVLLEFPSVVDAVECAVAVQAVMDQRNETFVPHVLAITTGTTVDFPNSDKFYHNVFSLSKTRPFDLGRYAAGSSRPVRFDRAGIVRVFCDIHSHMNAYILVFNHPFFAMTDTEGRYRIDNVPPGTYGVIAWNEGTSSETRPVTVPDGGVAELDFTVR